MNTTDRYSRYTRPGSILDEIPAGMFIAEVIRLTVVDALQPVARVRSMLRRTARR